MKNYALHTYNKHILNVVITEDTYTFKNEKRATSNVRFNRFIFLQQFFFFVSPVNQTRALRKLGKDIFDFRVNFNDTEETTRMYAH